MTKSSGKPIDLTGRKLGRLLVLRRGENVSPTQIGWVCRCDCGREETIARIRLPYREGTQPKNVVYECSFCRAKECVVCGTPFFASTVTNTCSLECRAIRLRECQREHARARRQTEDEEQRERRLNTMRAGYRRRKANATDEQREKRRAYIRNLTRQRRAEQVLAEVVSMSARAREIRDDDN